MAENNESDGQQELSANEIPEVQDNLAPLPSWAKSPEAVKEDREWPALDAVKQENNRRWLIVYGWIMIAVTVVLTLIFLGAFIVLAIHYLTPWNWLGEAQLNKVQGILLHGGIGSVVTSMVRSQISKAQ